MIKFLLYFTVGLFLALVAFYGVGSESYVLVRLGETAIQVTFWVAVIILYLCLVIFSVTRRFVKGFFLGGWRKQYIEMRCQHTKKIAIESFALGQYSKALKLFTKAEKSEPLQKQLYLMRIDSAIRSHQYKLASEISATCLNLNKQQQLSFDLLQAELALRASDFDNAKKQLTALSSKHASNPRVLLLNVQLCETLEDDKLLDMIKLTAKNRLLKDHELTSILIRYVRMKLARSASVDELKELTEWAQHYPLPNQLIIELIAQLSHRAQGTVAEKMLVTLLDQSWSDELYLLFCETEGQSVLAQIKQAERWLAADDQSATIIAGLVTLCTRVQNKEKLEVYQNKADSLNSSNMTTVR